MEISEADIIRVFELHGLKMSLRKIALEIGCSHETVRIILKSVNQMSPIRNKCPFKRICLKLNCEDCRSKNFVLQNEKIGESTYKFINKHIEELKARSEKYLEFRKKIIPKEKSVITERYEGYAKDDYEIEEVE